MGEKSATTVNLSHFFLDTYRCYTLIRNIFHSISCGAFSIISINLFLSGVAGQRDQGVNRAF